MRLGFVSIPFPPLLTLLPGWSPRGPRSCWGCSPWHPSSVTWLPTSPPPWAEKQRTWRRRDRWTDPPTVCLLTPHTAPPDPALPQPPLLRPLNSRHGALVLSDGAQAELECPAWVLQRVPKAQRPLPGVVRGCWGWQKVRGGSRVVDDVEFLPFLECQVILRPGLIVVQGDEECHPAACGTQRGPHRAPPPRTQSAQLGGAGEHPSPSSRHPADL